MKRFLILVLTLSLVLSGCSWLDGEYHSVKPHSAVSNKLSDDVIAVSDYNQLRDALVEMVNSGKQQSTIYITGFSLNDVEQYMRTAIMHVKESCAVGAYAVENITFESGTSGGAAAIAVDVSYIHGRQEILRIKNAKNMESVKDLIAFAVNNCDTSVVIKVDQYEDLDVELFVQEYANINPHLCMEVPQVAATTYPDRGEERILEIAFTYSTSRDALRIMQSMVSPIFSAAELYVQGSESDRQKYEQLYSFLMERFDYSIETSITPTYTLLRYGVGDSKAFASVYSIMCQNADLPCSVVQGTRDGEAYYWNLIRYDNVDYHVDLLNSNELGEFTVMLPEEMTGYVWDYSLYQ